MKIDGYKAFNGDMSNNYGAFFKEKKYYHISGDLKFGPSGNGFHYAKNIEDTFRYISDKENIKIASVTGYGKIKTYDDEYYGYYNMYVTNDIYINKILNRDEIISKIVLKGEDALKRFIVTGFRLTSDELIKIDSYITRDVRKYIDYYYLGHKDAFDINKVKVLKK